MNNCIHCKAIQFLYNLTLNLISSFMYWLEKHLEDGSFKTCYADTDSMALALTRSGPKSDDPEQNLRTLFDPLVKPSMKTSWEATWKTWFVTTNEIWDIRKPGKLKGNCLDKIVNIVYPYKYYNVAIP